MNKKIIFHIFIFLIGIFGSFLAIMPDIFPDFSQALLIGETREMRVGYEKLIRFLEDPYRKQGDIALKRGADGYYAIQRILHSFNPAAIPSPRELSGAKFGDISIGMGGPGFVFVNPGQGLVYNQLISYRVSTKGWIDVCEIRDLHSIIDSATGRYYSKIVFWFTTLAISIEVVYAIRGKLHKINNTCKADNCL